MNLAVGGTAHPSAAVTAVNTTIDSSALLYQQPDQRQLQPISYKIPQVGTVLVAQHHPQIPQHSQPVHHQHSQQVHLPQQHQMPTGIMSMAEKKKDIIAQAMREEKIYDDRGIQNVFYEKEPFLTTISNGMSLSDESYVAHRVAGNISQESSVASPSTSTQEPLLIPTNIAVAVKSNPPPFGNLNDLVQKQGKTICR